MRKKLLQHISIIALLLLSLPALAQDKIYLMDGTTVQAKVKQVGPKNIIYNRWDMKDGPEYMVLRRDVERIVYENGTEEMVTGSRRGTRVQEEARSRPVERARTPVPGYGANILSIAPIQMTNESAAGIGIHYERMVDKNGIFAIYLPVAIAFYDDEADNYTSVGSIYLKESRVFTYVYPGLKIYPAGSQRRVAYSVGPSFGLGFGTKYKLTERLDQNGSVIRSYNEGSVFKAGFLINNGLNIQPTRALYIGLELGVGISYYNNEDDNFSAGDEPMVQFNFKMGYRF